MGISGCQLDAETKDVLSEVRPLGTVLFARNATAAEGAYELNAELKAFMSPDPQICSLDQEGGRVARIREGVTVWPAMRRLGAHRDPALARAFGQALGLELRAMGFDLNYAPVLDVDTNPANPVIGERALSGDPGEVAELGSAVLEGLGQAGIGSCGKHFPGHGDTDLDSHLALPQIAHPRERLEAVEWPPFRAAIAAGMQAVMTAHVVVVALDPIRPATLSRAALAQPLREALGFAGIIISDDIEMRALADHFTPAEMAELGGQAGVDVFLACGSYGSTLALYRALVQQLEGLGADAADAAIRQGRRLKAWQAGMVRPLGTLAKLREVAGCAAHRALADSIEMLGPEA